MEKWQQDDDDDDDDDDDEATSMAIQVYLPAPGLYLVMPSSRKKPIQQSNREEDPSEYGRK
eukprot:scaffold186033_cov17-Tisochrysis_lutea.AAC.2